MGRLYPMSWDSQRWRARSGSNAMGMTDKQWKAYLKTELRCQKKIQEEIRNRNVEKAKMLIQEMIQRTQQNIEDA